MIDLKFNRKINKPIAEVWKFVTEEFPNAHEWATGTTNCQTTMSLDNYRDKTLAKEKMSAQGKNLMYSLS